MTESQRIAIAMSEKRQRINELLGVETRSAEQQTELETLTGEIQKLEPELRAAIAAEPEPAPVLVARDDSEGADYRRLLQRANLGTAVAAAIECRQADGAEGEVSQHHNLPAHMIALDLLRDPAPVETRAVTPLPNSVHVTQQPTVPPVFATGDAAYLNVPQRTVPVGDAVFPVLTDRPTVHGPHTDSTDAPETTGAFSADVLEPGRLQASYIYRRSDAARFPSMAESLRQALSMGLSEKTDAQLITQIVADVARTDAAVLDTFATYRKRLVYSVIDGRYARSESSIRLLFGAATLAHCVAQYRANAADDSCVDSLRRIAGGLEVSAHIPAVAAHKQDAIVRLGGREDAVIGAWQGVEIIDDPYSGSGKGERELTAVMLAAFKVTRPAGFKRIQTQHQ